MSITPDVTAGRVKIEKIAADLKHAFGYFPLDCLLYLRDNKHRLMRGKYTDGNGNGCLFWQLSRNLPEGMRISSKQELTRFFTGGDGYPFCEMPEYQPARWIVRLVDGQVCETLRARYGEGVTQLDWDYMLSVLDEVIAQREAGEREAAAVEGRVQLRIAKFRAQNEAAMATA